MKENKSTCKTHLFQFSNDSVLIWCFQATIIGINQHLESSELFFSLFFANLFDLKNSLFFLSHKHTLARYQNNNQTIIQQKKW